ncbi:hypothetical protein LV79_004582 [Actinokineospora globicatena]|nr:hypothetical protein [Actinokineospora globicatena]GLW77744.1 hypothetical protein Aglo01_22260 [Actinokineospora globicatena]GLW85587.1 hypothetical protein Aglo02_32270 [Actinokineospora globicatena]
MWTLGARRSFKIEPPIHDRAAGGKAADGWLAGSGRAPRVSVQAGTGEAAVRIGWWCRRARAAHKIEPA